MLNVLHTECVVCAQCKFRAERAHVHPTTSAATARLRAPKLSPLNGSSMREASCCLSLQKALKAASKSGSPAGDPWLSAEGPAARAACGVAGLLPAAGAAWASWSLAHSTSPLLHRSQQLLPCVPLPQHSVRGRSKADTLRWVRRRPSRAGRAVISTLPGRTTYLRSEKKRKLETLLKTKQH